MILKIFEVGERHIGAVEVVRAGLDDVESALRAFGRGHRLERGVEERGAKLLQLFVKLVGRPREATLFDCLKRGLLKLFVCEVRQKFLRRVAVMVAGVGPEEFRVVSNLPERGGADALRVRDYGFEYALLPEAESRHLVVDYGVNGDGRLAQVVCENLLSRREVAEALGLDLKYAGRADALDERGAFRLARGARGRRPLRERGREETEDDCGGEEDGQRCACGRLHFENLRRFFCVLPGVEASMP